MAQRDFATLHLIYFIFTHENVVVLVERKPLQVKPKNGAVFEVFANCAVEVFFFRFNLPAQKVNQKPLSCFIITHSSVCDVRATAVKYHFVVNVDP